MARTKKPSGTQQMKTGNDFLEKARSAGAVVSDQPDSRGLFQVETPSGKMWMAGGKQTLDPRTRKNYRHWFRLLGLLTILIFTSKFWWWPFVHAVRWIVEVM